MGRVLKTNVIGLVYLKKKDNLKIRINKATLSFIKTLKRWIFCYIGIKLKFRGIFLHLKKKQLKKQVIELKLKKKIKGLLHFICD